MFCRSQRLPTQQNKKKSYDSHIHRLRNSYRYLRGRGGRDRYRNASGHREKVGDRASNAHFVA